MWGVVHRFAGGPLTAPGQDPCRYAVPGSLSKVLREAGFHPVEEETKTLPWTWPGTAGEIWELTQAASTPFLPMLQRVPAEQRDQVDQQVVRGVQQYVDGENIKFGAVVVLASGVKS